MIIWSFILDIVVIIIIEYAEQDSNKLFTSTICWNVNDT